MLIRRMTLEDIVSVVAIERKCFSLPWSEKSFEDSISREDTLFLVCEDDEKMQEETSLDVKCGDAKITGYIGMYLSFNEASITNVAVSPEFRKKGYGDQLVTVAKEVAKEADIQTIFLEVRVSNEPAISLYRKHGFEELGIRKKFYEHPVEDAYIMSCKL